MDQKTLFDALRVALSLALFKGGPEDMPYSLPLARAAAAIAAISTALLLSLVTPLPMAIATGIGGAVGVAFFTAQLLKGRKLDNRAAQTITAQLLVGSLFALAMWPAMVALVPSLNEMMDTMRATIEAAQVKQPTIVPPAELKNPPPTWAALWCDVLFIWSLVASTRINRLAANLGWGGGWLTTLLGLFVLLGFVLLAQLVAAMVFGVG